MSKEMAVITGASSGIGLELAHLFAADGYDLIVTARRVDRLQQLADELHRAHGSTVHVIQMDSAQPYAGAALWQAISAITPQVDVLVNNAGIGDSGEFSERPPEDIERMIHLNISTLTSLTRHALPGMIARKRGKILNLSSLVGFQPAGPSMSVYYATKSYVLSFSRGIRRELAGTGVSVTALCPGPTRTEFEQTANVGDTRIYHWPEPMGARAVAHAGYEGMQRNRAVVIPGLFNQFLAFSAKLSPAFVVIEINRFLLAKRG